MPREEATAIAAVTPEGDSPETYAGAAAEGTGPLLTPEETLEETTAASATPDVDAMPPAAQETVGSEDEQSSPGESA